MDGDSKETLELLAYLYLQHSKFDKAVNLLKALKKLHPTDHHIARSLAYALLNVGDYQGSLIQAEASISDDLPTNLKMASTLIKSKALWGLGREDAAKETISQIIKIRNT